MEVLIPKYITKRIEPFSWMHFKDLQIEKFSFVLVVLLYFAISIILQFPDFVQLVSFWHGVRPLGYFD